jgi:hypothetical protein
MYDKWNDWIQLSPQTKKVIRRTIKPTGTTMPIAGTPQGVYTAVYPKNTLYKAMREAFDLALPDYKQEIF